MFTFLAVIFFLLVAIAISCIVAAIVVTIISKHKENKLWVEFAKLEDDPNWGRKDV